MRNVVLGRLWSALAAATVAAHAAAAAVAATRDTEEENTETLQATTTQCHKQGEPKAK